MKSKTGLLLATLLVMMQSAHAADLIVLSAAAMKGALENLPEQYLAATGDHVRLVYGTAGQVRDRAVSGQAFDLVIVPSEPLAKLTERHLVEKGSQVDIARVRLGVAVKAGAALPGINDDQAFTKVLLDAPSIGMADPATGATSGIYLARLIDRLGVGGTVGLKVKYYPEGQTAMEAMARGEVSLGLGQISEIKPVHGVTLVGPIPEDLQLVTTYAAGIGTKSERPDAAKKLLSYLTGPTVQTSLKANGFDLVLPAN
ncbi:substrate-binding domain-containing protein [Paraburkholderia sp. FT54]|uniref:molybdate ABC transporter substrate-binding protein n=1 Tax=Paraburkholderia sp. FT54 TaxID=3074437 RepID=UPI0028776D07|nr:substrate-binding domain-containing protein [Paraburkholderia sp. FT54]WNC94757.1 substrate-binding domain-containing protein [Paraburkholderia sp. FT54]